MLTSTWNTIQIAKVKKHMSPERGEHSHTWRWWGTYTLLTPFFDIFRSHLVPCYAQLDLIDPLFPQKKICLSLLHLVPEIKWPKVGIFFHTNLSFHTVEAICTTFLVDFRSCWSPFSLLLDFDDSSFLQNLRSSWVHFSMHAVPPLPRQFCEVLPLPPQAFKMITYSCSFSYLSG